MRYMKKDLLSVKKFAELTGVSRRTIHRQIAEKKIETKKYTVRMVGIPASELALWMKNRK